MKYCHVLGVGLLKKTLSWQQISCIPCNGNLENSPCISARWSMSLDVQHILHTGTWLRGEHSGKFCIISCNSVLLQVTNRWKHCHGDNVNNHKKLLMPQSYRGYPHKAWGRILAATYKVSECHRQKWLNSQASDFHYKECTEVAVTLVFSWLYLSLHSYFKDVDFSALPYC